MLLRLLLLVCGTVAFPHQAETHLVPEREPQDTHALTVSRAQPQSKPAFDSFKFEEGLENSEDMRFRERTNSRVRSIETIIEEIATAQKYDFAHINPTPLPDLEPIKPVLRAMVPEAWKAVETLQGKLPESEGLVTRLVSDLIWRMAQAGETAMKEAKKSSSPPPINEAFYEELVPEFRKHVQYFTQNLELLFRRVPEDLRDIASLFFATAGKKSAKLVNIRTVGNDVHNFGREALYLDFDVEGTRKEVLYKTSSVSTNLMFMGSPESFQVSSLDGEPLEGESFSTWLNTKQQKFRTIHVLARDLTKCSALGYGYVEFLHPEPNVESRQKWEEISVVAGKIAAMSYVLLMGDLHYENVFLLEDGPVLIDTEIRDRIFFNERICASLARGGLATERGGMVLNYKNHNMPLYQGQNVKYEENSWKQGFHEMMMLLEVNGKELETWLRKISPFVVHRVLPIGSQLWAAAVLWVKEAHDDVNRIVEFMKNTKGVTKYLVDKLKSGKDLAVFADSLRFCLPELSEGSIPTFYSFASRDYIETLIAPEVCAKIPTKLTEEDQQKVRWSKEHQETEVMYSILLAPRQEGEFTYFPKLWANEVLARLEAGVTSLTVPNELDQKECVRMYGTFPSL